MPENDIYFIQRCLDGHPDDFRHLVTRYKGPLMGHLAGQLESTDSAEEALQEVFVRCYFGLSKLEKPQSFFAWMLGIANNVVKEQFRSKQKQRQVTETLAKMPAPTNTVRQWPLAKAVARLDDFYRQIILLRYYGGHSCKDVAQILNMPLGTVTKSLSRAYAQLRDTLSVEESEVQI